MGESECTVAGYAVTTDCGSIEIKEIGALDFQLKFIDALSDLLGQSRTPKISVSLFEPKEVVETGVNITPVDISDLSQVESKKTFLFRLDVSNNETDINKAYGKLLLTVKIIVNVLRIVQTRERLTIIQKMSIINSKRVSLSLNITKTV